MMKIKYSEAPDVEETGNRVETTATSVVIEDAQVEDFQQVVREHSGQDVEVTIKFKESK